MKPKITFLSSERLAQLEKYEASDRVAVGYAMDYPDGLVSGMHGHSKAQLIYGISGVMRVETDDALFVLPPTKALLLPAEAMHSITMDGNVAMRELLIHRSIADSLGSQARALGVSPLLRELIVAVCAEPTDWKLDGRVPHLVALIIDEIKRAKTLLTRLPLPRDVRVARVTNAIIQAPHDPRSLEGWAEISGASSRTLARLFHSETGLSFGQWRLQARLNAAFVMLMMGEDIPRVAAAVGFSGQSAFGAAFRRTFGLTPGQARLLHTSEIAGQTNLSV